MRISYICKDYYHDCLELLNFFHETSWNLIKFEAEETANPNTPSLRGISIGSFFMTKRWQLPYDAATSIRLFSFQVGVRFYV